ncbi:maleylpyruvate isomerase family mycothiol-dependent enzyme [Nocardia sp. NPDC058658]|uniref:maleylpyruvate isomerase family mycothiol-dependent enzyme n=1 Tax=Nocardia sp. NPDC058658 TaxID=3346580 RepID=UPI00364CFB01
MSDSEVRAATAQQRAETAEFLAGLDAESWDEPTLCEGWRVREVAAHLSMPYRTSLPRFVLGMIAARGNFDRLADRVARDDAARLSTTELVAAIGDNTEHPWKPPGGGFAGALSHDVIHGLDITVALGHTDPLPLDRMRMVLDALNPRSVEYFSVDLGGIALQATDLDFRYGEGEVVSGRAQDLLLVLCGRKLPTGYLEGESAVRFTSG